MPLLINFLKLILPEQGVKIWTSIQNKVAVNHFCTTFEEMAEQIVVSDAHGADTYHACASYVTAQNRRAANAGWMKCLWADVDVGEGKPYATAQEAIQACDEFCARVAIPLPALVGSGGGVHAYWPLDRVLTRDEWIPLAGRLKLLAQTHGFHIDPSCTADAARILRPPGTKNYKLPGNPREVGILDTPEIFFALLSCDDIAEKLINAPCGTSPQSVNKSLNFTNSGLSSGLSKAFDPTVGVAKGSRGSNRVRYAGELVARGLARDDVSARVTAWDLLCDPPEGAAAVEHSVKSAFAMHAQKHPESTLSPVPIAVDAPSFTPPKLPPDYYWSNLKLIIDIEDDTGVKKPRVISNFPVYLIGFLNEEGYDEKHSYLFERYHPAEGYKQFNLSADECNGPGWYSRFVEKGCTLINGAHKFFRNYIEDMANMRRQTGITGTLFSQMGWKENMTQFLVGDDLCKADGNVERVSGNKAISTLMAAMPARVGSQAAWTACADGFAAPTLEPHLFMILLSAAAPLMAFCVDDGNGGSVVSFVTEGGGMGKTPAAMAAASIWGDKSATVVSNNTDNRLLDDAARRCNLVLIQEERMAIDPDYNLELLKKFSAGVNRSRLSSSGEPMGIPGTFKTILITIANTSLLDSVRMAKGGDTMSKRILEIEFDRPNEALVETIGGLAREMLQNSGHMGRTLARLYVQPEYRDYIYHHLGTRPDKSVGVTVKKYWELLKTTPDHRFLAWPIACVEVAANIITHNGLMHFNVERQMDWVSDQARSRIANTVGEDYLSKFIRFMADNIDSVIRVKGPYDKKKGPLVIIGREPSRRAIARSEIDTHHMYIARDAIHEWCELKGIRPKNLQNDLAKRGILLESSKLCTLGAGVGIDVGRPLCWVIDTNHKEMAGEEGALEKVMTLAVDNGKKEQKS